MVEAKAGRSINPILLGRLIQSCVGQQKRAKLRYKQTAVFVSVALWEPCLMIPLGTQRQA